MINVRRELEKLWRQQVPDPLWDYLDEQGYVGEVREGSLTIEGLLKEARRVIAASRREMSAVADNEIARQVAGVASSARIDALSAIFAAWASSGFLRSVWSARTARMSTDTSWRHSPSPGRVHRVP